MARSAATMKAMKEVKQEQEEIKEAKKEERRIAIQNGDYRKEPDASEKYVKERRKAFKNLTVAMHIEAMNTTESDPGSDYFNSRSGKTIIDILPQPLPYFSLSLRYITLKSLCLCPKKLYYTLLDE